MRGLSDFTPFMTVLAMVYLVFPARGKVAEGTLPKLGCKHSSHGKSSTAQKSWLFQHSLLSSLGKRDQREADEGKNIFCPQNHLSSLMRCSPGL